jgi:hypothetical protein
MFATLFLAAVSAASTPVVTPGVYTYTATYQGVQSGTSTLTVRNVRPGTTIEEKATGFISGMTVAGTATLNLDENLVPTVYNGSYDSGTQRSVITVTVSPQAATIVGTTTGGYPEAISLKPPAQHLVVIEPGLMAGLFPLAAEMQAWKYDPIIAVAPSTGRGEPFELDTTAKPKRPDGVPADDTEITFGGPLSFTIWYDPATYVPDAVVVPSQDAVVTRVRQ